MKSILGDGRYEVLRSIGQGASGKVYAVIDNRLGVQRALKYMPISPDAAANKRQSREGRIMARLEHPNIVTVYDSFQDDGHRCVVMTLCSGGNLHERTAEPASLDLETLLDIGEQIRQALAAAHQEGVLHRDIKPHNILFDENHTPYLSDFGLSWMASEPDTLTRTGALMGTVPFMAPSLRRGEPHTEATDRYALAATMVSVATGSIPADLDRPGVIDDLPASLAAWVRALLDGDALLSDTHTPPIPSPAQPKWRRVLIPLMGAVGMGALLGGTFMTGPVQTASPPAISERWAQLPLCHNGPFVAVEKYPQYDQDPTLRREGSGVILAELNDTAGLDLAVGYVIGGALEIYPNTDGRLFPRDENYTLTPPIRLRIDYDGQGMSAGDFNGDGLMEIAWQRRLQSGFQILRHTDNATFDIEDFSIPSAVSPPILTDITGDGCDELLFLSGQPPSTLMMVTTQCSNQYQLEQSLLSNVSSLQQHGKHLLVLHDEQVHQLDPETKEWEPLTAWPLTMRTNQGLFAQTEQPDLLLAVSINADGQLCRIDAQSAPSNIAHGDINADGLTDRVVVQSCGYCSSSLSVAHGQPVPSP